jgi:hypothetical protein
MKLRRIRWADGRTSIDPEDYEVMDARGARIGRIYRTDAVAAVMCGAGLFTSSPSTMFRQPARNHRVRRPWRRSKRRGPRASRDSKKPMYWNEQLAYTSRPRAGPCAAWRRYSMPIGQSRRTFRGATLNAIIGSPPACCWCAPPIQDQLRTFKRPPMQSLNALEREGWMSRDASTTVLLRSESKVIK